jgi:histidinol-phosphate aminotransferase
MKDYLKKVIRKSYTEDKLNYDIVLDQSERFVNYDDKIFKSFLSTLTQHDFSLYPNTYTFNQTVADFYGVKNEEISSNFGSDGCIKSIIDSFCEKDSEIIVPIPNFPMYEVYSNINQNKFIGVPLKEDLTTDIDEIIDKVNNNTSLIILSNPTSPIGEYIHFDQIKRILDLGIPVLIDEAYIEFCEIGKSVIDKINEYKNLLITRTFSKSNGAAGIRFGCVISNKENIDLIFKLKPMFEMTGPSMKYVKFLIENYHIVQLYIKETLEEKKNIISYLKSKKYKVIDSNCNWIHFNNDNENQKLQDIFKENNILIRFGDIPHSNLKNWCRLTIQPKLLKTKLFKLL